MCFLLKYIHIYWIFMIFFSNFFLWFCGWKFDFFVNVLIFAFVLDVWCFRYMSSFTKALKKHWKQTWKQTLIILFLKKEFLIDLHCITPWNSYFFVGHGKGKKVNTEAILLRCSTNLLKKRSWHRHFLVSLTIYKLFCN